MKVRSNDEVVVITGDDKGTKAKVLKVLSEKNKIVVEGVNLVYKHVKPNQRNPQGGRLSKEMPIDVSNVLLFCPGCNGPSRVGYRILDNGQKERYCKRCDSGLGTLGPPKPSRARTKPQG
jgi:large subunit ribosomal protein L24